MLKNGERMIIKRRSNGACVAERVCHQCQKEFVGERNTCSQCRGQQWRTEGKFGPAYQRQYYRRPDKGVSRPMQQAPGRAAALERHRQRIHREIEAITQAGFNPDTTPLTEILDAKVRLDNF